MKMFVCVPALAMVLSGCAMDGMNESMGIGTVSSAKSTFDGATIVQMKPAFLAEGEKNAAGNVHLGARWSSATPDKVALLLSYESFGGLVGKPFANISSLSVNIGGKIQDFPVVGLTQHNTGTPGALMDASSTNAVMVPLVLLRQMTQAADVRLRIVTDAGYQDSIFSNPAMAGGAETAIVPMRKFLTQVDAAKVKS